MFDINSFGNISSGASEGPKLWSYGSSTDSLATISTSGYFNDVKFRIDSNDLIYVSASDGVEQLKVTSNNGATATTSVYVPASGGAPNTATYITQTPNADLPNEVAMSTLTNVTAAAADLLLVLDASDSGNPKSVTAQSIADLGGGGGAGVVLPTIANNLAFFTDTAGTISSGASSAIHNGSMQAYGNLISGKNDGTLQGGLQLFPPDTGSGYFLIQALNAGGNFTTTLYTNPSQSGNKSFLFPNAVTNTELYLAAYDGAAPPAAGNIAVYGSNLGLLVDGGAPVLRSTGMLTVTAANIKSMYTTPVQLIASPGANRLIVITRAVVEFVQIAPTYTGGGQLSIQYDNTAAGAGLAVVLTLVDPAAGASDISFSPGNGDSGGILDPSLFINKGIFISNTGALFATGNGTLRVTLQYYIATTVA